MDIVLIILGQIAFVEILVIIFLLILLSKRPKKEKEKIILNVSSVPESAELTKIKNSVQINKTSEPKREIRNLRKIIALIIPALFLGFIFYSNFLVSKEFNYFYDIGSEQDVNKPYLTPLQRVSEALSEEDTNYRNLVSQLVYFDVPIPRGSDNVLVEVKIIGNLENSTIYLGAKNKEEWSYQSKKIYSPLLEKIGLTGNILKLNEQMPEISSTDEIPNGAIVATDTEIRQRENKQSYEVKETTINNYLRGEHVFYVYLSSSLDLYVEKQDLNWYEGTDELKVELFDLDGNLLENLTLEDDEIISASKSKDKTIGGTLKKENLNEGVYKIVFSDFDGIITKIKINTNKIVANKIFTAESANYLVEEDRQVSFYTNSNKESVLEFTTWHEPYLQNISVNNKKIKIQERAKPQKLSVARGEYNIAVPKSNVIISSRNYLTFSKENYFEPFEYFVVALPETEDALQGVDYIVTDYSPVKKQDEGTVAYLTLDVKDLYIQDGKLNLMFNVPALNENVAEQNKTQVGVDWINITIHKRGYLDEENKI